MPYTADKPAPRETPEQLRARIPGWGADKDPADRPAVPREQAEPTGAHWDLPEQQVAAWPRERSIEHARLTPVFGTSAPPKGLSGLVRHYAYRRFSEGRAAHWLLLIAADRIDVVESTLGAALRGHPDNPVAETGIKGEVTGHGIASRRGPRTDKRHHVIDPVIVAGPWVAGGLGAVLGARALARRIAAR